MLINAIVRCHSLDVPLAIGLQPIGVDIVEICLHCVDAWMMISIESSETIERQAAKLTFPWSCQFLQISIVLLFSEVLWLNRDLLGSCEPQRWKSDIDWFHKLRVHDILFCTKITSKLWNLTSLRWCCYDLHHLLIDQLLISQCPEVFRANDVHAELHWRWRDSAISAMLAHNWWENSKYSFRPNGSLSGDFFLLWECVYLTLPYVTVRGSTSGLSITSVNVNLRIPKWICNGNIFILRFCMCNRLPLGWVVLETKSRAANWRLFRLSAKQRLYAGLESESFRVSGEVTEHNMNKLAECFSVGFGQHWGRIWRYSWEYFSYLATRSVGMPNNKEYFFE